MDISVVIPLYNEDESIPELYAWIARVMKEHHFTYEVIFINDGSTDRSWEIISELHKQQPDVVKGIKFRRNYGKSPALYCGFEQAQGDVVITMDADLQDSRKRAMTLSLVISRNVTIPSQRPSPRNSSMPQPARSAASRICTTSTAA